MHSDCSTFSAFLYIVLSQSIINSLFSFDYFISTWRLLLDSIAIGFLSPVILDWLKLAGVSLWEGSALIQLHDLTADKPTVWRVILNLHPSQTFIDATNAVISDIEPLVMTPYSLRRAQTIEASTSRPIIKRVNARRLSEDKVDRKPRLLF